MLLNSAHELTLKRRSRGCQDSTSLVLALLVVVDVVCFFVFSVCVCMRPNTSLFFREEEEDERKAQASGTHAGVNIAATTHVVALRLRSLTSASATYGKTEWQPLYTWSVTCV
jgi:hypothetical protein